MKEDVEQKSFIDLDKNRFSMLVTHRRFGKTVLLVNHLVSRAMRFKGTDGRFYYIGPTYKQVKRFISELKNGATEEELPFSINALVAEVKAVGKGGSVILKLDIKPHETMAGVVFVTDTITINSPKRPRSSSLFFVNDENNLVRNDPKQMNIEDLIKVETKKENQNVRG